MEQPADQLSEFGKIAVFLILGVLFVMVSYGISYLLSKNKPSPEKLSTYECGEEPEGNARMQFNNRFYVIALIFLLFDVEIVFLFPWSAVFAQKEIMDSVPVWGWFSFTEMIVFVCILLVGLLYVWMKGDLEWIRPQQIIPKTDSKVPMELYAGINQEKYVTRAFTAGAPVSAEAQPPSTQPAGTPAPRPAFKPRIMTRKK